MPTNYAPTLQLSFARSDRLDPRITATRASTKTYFDYTGTMRTAAINEFPREYDPSTLKCLGRSFWEARTNLLTYSQEFDNAAWTKTRSSITANATTAPDGTVTADKLVEDSTATNTHPITGFVSGTAPNQTLSFSVYIKADERSWIRGLIWDSDAPTNQVAAYFNLSSGVVGTVANGGAGTGATASISSVGNGWYRCTVTGKPNTSGTNSGVAIYLSTADNVVSYTGDGSSGLYIWGAQLEVGATPTPYIPTTSAAATRAADVASMTSTNFSSWYNQTEGTFIVSAMLTATTTDTTARVLYAAGDSTLSGGLADVIYTSRGASSALVVGVTMDGGVVQRATTAAGSISANTLFTFADTYKVNDFGSGLNGAAVVADTAGSLPVPTGLSIGGASQAWASAGSTYNINGWIYSLTYFNSRLSNTVLQQLSAAQTQSVLPTLQLRFDKTDNLDPRITATRASTKTYFNSAGVLSTAAVNEFPREYDPSTLVCLGRSFWEARTNLLTYSEQFDNAAWTTVSSSITANNTTSPDGTSTADKLIASGGLTDHLIDQVSTSISVGTAITQSIFAKSSECTEIRFRIGSAGAFAGSPQAGTFTLTGSGSAAVSQGSPTLSISSVGNGWYRCILNTTTIATGAVTVRISPSIGGTTTFNADGSGIYIWGAQLEAGATPTPYIPTTSASVTRAADVASMTGTNFSSWYNQTEGTFLVVSPQTSSSTAVVQQYLDVSDASVNERMFLRRSSAGIPALAGVDGGVTQFDISDLTVVSGSASFAACFGYKVNDVAMSVDGRPVSTDTAATIPTTTQLHIGQNFGSSQFANCWLSRITYWPSRLPNSDLQILSRST